MKKIGTNLIQLKNFQKSIAFLKKSIYTIFQLRNLCLNIWYEIGKQKNPDSFAVSLQR